MSSSTSLEHMRPVLTRRDILARAGHGFGAIALGSLLRDSAQAKARVNPLAAKPPNFAPKAKSVIFLFMVGGPSHIDTFDPKPALKKYECQKLPDSYGKVISQFTAGDTPLLASPWKFSRHGHCGMELSTLYPPLSESLTTTSSLRPFY